MWLYIKLAWRNIFRNKRRTIIASTAIGIALACLLFFDSVMIGMENSLVESVTSSFLGQAEIHRQGFRATQESDLTINNLNKVTASLAQERIVDKFSVRTLSIGMITSPQNLSSVMLVGVDPEKEKFLSTVDESITQGDFFKGNDTRDIVIGSELADVLGVALDDRVVVTVSQAKGGDLAQDLFRVSGIFTTGTKEMDNGMIFVHFSKAQAMLGIPGQAHEIAVKFTDLRYAADDKLFFWGKYSTDGNEAVSWGTLLPSLKGVFEFTGVLRLVMSAILMFLVLFSIINTLFMSLYERLFELGVLRAVGTKPWGVIKLMLSEAGALGVLSIIVGMTLGLIVTGLTAAVGIDYRGIEFAGATIQNLLYPVMKPFQFIVYPIGLFIFTLIVGLYPAVTAARMSIVDAIHKSL
jgi:ABC-type lipoprotein release transport system permease subunit